MTSTVPRIRSLAIAFLTVHVFRIVGVFVAAAALLFGLGETWMLVGAGIYLGCLLCVAIIGWRVQRLSADLKQHPASSNQNALNAIPDALDAPLSLQGRNESD